MDNLVDGRYLNSFDDEFVYNIEHDVKLFIAKRHPSKNSVLLFPPVDNFHRFLIHKVCDKLGTEFDIVTFSVGIGPQRRTVVCFKHQLSKDYKLNSPAKKPNIQYKRFDDSEYNWPTKSKTTKRFKPELSPNSGTNKGFFKMGVENASPDTNTCSLKSSSKINSIEIYKPPGARKSLNDNQCSTAEAGQSNATITTNSYKDNEYSHTVANKNSQARTRERRPDRAVYMAPRGRRSSHTPCTSANITAANSPNTPYTDVPSSVSDTLSLISAESEVPNKLVSSELEGVVDQEENVVTPKATPTTKLPSPVIHDLSCDKLLPTNNNLNCDNIPNNKDTTFIDISSIKNKNKYNFEQSLINNNNNIASVMASITIESAGDLNNDTKYVKDNDYNKDEEKELRRASQEINRSNRKIIKQTFNSDVLEIATTSSATLTTSQTKPTNTNANSTSSNSRNNNNTCLKNKTEKEAVTVNTAEDDWDTIFDDNGECLDPKLFDDLTAAVGKVTIEKPQHDYRIYHSKQSILNDEEFPHVLEVSNFPVEFETRDLMMIFSPYKSTGFDIKWVDDTHALAVFSSSKIAAEVLSASHTLVCVKPLAEATNESRAKARKCSGSLQPYRQRPETCAALARRLVTSALGVKLKTAREEREVERRVLKEAKERKLLAAKQQNEIWDS